MSDFERRARELLQQSSEQLDGHTRSRLTQARFAAVQASRRRDSYTALRSWLPLGGVAAAVLAAVIWGGSWLQSAGTVFQVPAETAHVQGPLEDMELMASDESLEMIEDVEFYAWLDSDPDLLTGAG